MARFAFRITKQEMKAGAVGVRAGFCLAPALQKKIKRNGGVASTTEDTKERKKPKGEQNEKLPSPHKSPRYKGSSLERRRAAARQASASLG